MKRIAVLVAALSVFTIFTEKSSADEVKKYAGFVGIQDCETKSVVTSCGGRAVRPFLLRIFTLN